MRRRHFVFVVSLSMAMFLGLGSAPAATRLRVVVTVGDLAAIARAVLGDGGQVVLLARPTQDPHFVDARPNLILDLNRADALVSMGLDYEVGWLPVLVRGARNPRIQQGAPGYIVAATAVPLLEVPQQRIDRSMGDIHPGGNPHFTMDPRNGIAVARFLATAFAGLAHDNRALYERNAATFTAALTARVQGWQAALAPHRGTAVVTYHKSFVYLTGWAGLVEAGTIEPKPGIPPNAAHVAELIGTIRARHVPVILQERWYPSTVAEQIAVQSGARLVLVPGMTPEGGNYGDHIDEVVRDLLAGLAAAGGGHKP
ncbi:MAG TPA: metal ABC transporter substrate-binding protein [Polyangia bacterium]|nr:metal ABC transporter substrate-binding protein [Polyangia bacterium]